MIRHLQVLRSEEGKISLFDRTDNFIASYAGGVWVADDVFEFIELEQFSQVDDSEALRLLSEARMALNRPLD